MVLKVPLVSTLQHMHPGLEPFFGQFLHLGSAYTRSNIPVPGYIEALTKAFLAGARRAPNLKNLSAQRKISGTRALGNPSISSPVHHSSKNIKWSGTIHGHAALWHF